MQLLALLSIAKSRFLVSVWLGGVHKKAAKLVAEAVSTTIF